MNFLNQRKLPQVRKKNIFPSLKKFKERNKYLKLWKSYNTCRRGCDSLESFGNPSTFFLFFFFILLLDRPCPNVSRQYDIKNINKFFFFYLECYLSFHWLLSCRALTSVWRIQWRLDWLRNHHRRRCRPSRSQPPSPPCLVFRQLSLIKNLYYVLFLFFLFQR